MLPASVRPVSRPATIPRWLCGRSPSASRSRWVAGWPAWPSKARRCAPAARASEVAAAYNGVNGPARLCAPAVNGRFPFVPGSSNETPLDDFAKLFAPGGLIDGFFNTQLAALCEHHRQDLDAPGGGRRVGAGLAGGHHPVPARRRHP